MTTKKPKPDTGYEPYSIEVTEGALPYEVLTATKVEPADTGWMLTCGSTGFFVPYLSDGYGDRKVRPVVVPHVGDEIALYGGWGQTISGIVINGEVVFYRTEEQREAYRRRWREDYEARQRREFLASQKKMDANYKKLDPVFKQRIDRFREADPKFRESSEGYEVFCLLEAQKFADWAQTQSDIEGIRSADDYLNNDTYGGTDSFDAFSNMWTKMEEAGIASKDHSNNTFGGAVAMARSLLRHRAGEEVEV